MKWDWVPGVRCGEFRLGKTVSRKGYSLRVVRLEPSCEGADWETYRVGREEARVRVQDGIVVGVECVRSCLFDGAELIGMKRRMISSVIGTSPKRKRRWSDGSEMLEVSELGLTLWMENGQVESVTVELILDDEVTVKQGHKQSQPSRRRKQRAI